MSVIATVAARGPAIVGSKSTEILQFAPTATLVPHVLVDAKEDAFTPVTPMLVIDKAPCPLLVNVTDCDAVAVPTADDPNERLVAERVTAGPSPVPLSAMLCGDPPALSTIVTAAVRAPPVVGAKCPWMLQLAPAARLVPQVFAKAKDDAFVPVTVMLVIDKVAVPGLVRVTYCDAVADPTASEPNNRLVADRLAAEPRPVPVNPMLCGDPEALSVIVTVALREPPVVGSKSPVMLQFAPAATLVPHVFVKRNEDAFAPVTAMLAIDKVPCPLLVNVTICDAVAVPTAEEPKERLGADRVTAGPSPVPLNAMLCGDPPALSVMMIAAASGPLATGLKCPWMLQLAPAARVTAQEFANVNEEAFAPVKAMLLMFKGALPELVSVIYCDAVEPPTGSEPNATLATESVAAGPSPVPVSAMLCGDPPTLSVRVMVALREPPVVGSKSPVMLQFAPAATLVPHVFVNGNEVGFAPVTLMLVIDKVPCPLLVSVTVCDAVAVPTAEEP